MKKVEFIMIIIDFSVHVVCTVFMTSPRLTFIADKLVTFVVQKLCAVNIDELHGKCRSISIWRIGRFYRDQQAFG